MPKIKTTATSRSARTTRAKRTRSKNTAKKQLLLRHTRLHAYLLLLAALVIGAVFAHKSLIALADTAPTPIVTSFSGTLSGSSFAKGYNFQPAGKLTVTLSYSGVPDGSVALDAYLHDNTNPYKLLTVSSYGNPITIQLDVAANAGNLAFEVYHPTNPAGTYTLTFSNVPNPAATTTTDPFRSMPCSYIPQQYVYPFYVEPPIWPCSGYTNTSFRSHTNPIPAPSSSTSSPSPASPIPGSQPSTTPSGDFTPPTTPDGLQARANGPNDIALSWAPANDSGSGLAGYYVYRGTSPTNATQLKTVNSPSYTDQSVRASTTYYYYIVAFDKSGNSSKASATVSTTTKDLPPDLPPVTITLPKDGAAVSKITTIRGVAGNGKPVKSVQVEVDNDGFITAEQHTTNNGLVTWSYVINTVLYPDTEHTITAKVIDAESKVGTASIRLLFKNHAYSADPPLSQGTWVSPEGMTVVVNSKGKNPHTGQEWTIADLYYMIKACAVGTKDFSTIAPHYTAEISDTVGGWADDYTTVGVGTGASGNWSNYTSTTHLNGSVGAMLTVPYHVSCYEYGHAWTEYYYYMVNYPSTGYGLHDSNIYDPPKYLSARWVAQDGTVTLAQNNVCKNSTDGWDGCMTDDRRILFGGPGTNGGDYSAYLVPGEPSTEYREPIVRYINGSMIPPQNQPGLSDWYTNHWMTGQ